MLNFKKNYNFLGRSKACPFRTIVSGTIANRTIVSRELRFVKFMFYMCDCLFVCACVCSCVCVRVRACVFEVLGGVIMIIFSYHLNQIRLAQPSRSWTSCFGTWPCEDDRISAKLLTQFVSGAKKKERKTPTAWKVAILNCTTKAVMTGLIRVWERKTVLYHPYLTGDCQGDLPDEL